MKLLQMLTPAVSSKLKTDSLWNVLGFGVTGLNGFFALLLISRVYDASILGRFNVAYAIYILLSQLAGMGVHFSVLKHTAQYKESKEKVIPILYAGILLTVFASTTTIAVAYFTRNLFKIFFDHPTGINSMVLILPALLFFTLNKVILAFHNGYRRMKLFAVFTALRSIFMITCLILFVLTEVAGNFITAIFPISEFVLFAIISIYSLRNFSFRILKKVPNWIKIHFNFGLKAMAGSIFFDVNTRVDVLVLGVFISDRWVGIYSFAGLMIDGFNQLLFVFCKIMNPLITDYRYNKSKKELRNMIIKARNLFYKSLSPIGILGVFLYPLIISWVQLDPDYINGWIPFIILLSGSLLSTGYAPFLMLLNQTGYPLTQSILFIFLFLINLLLNLILIPGFGIPGAAIATSLSYVSFVFLLKTLTLRKLGIRI